MTQEISGKPDTDIALTNIGATTSGNDFITGTGGAADTLNGGKGNDKMSGGDGAGNTLTLSGLAIGDLDKGDLVF